MAFLAEGLPVPTFHVFVSNAAVGWRRPAAAAAAAAAVNSSSSSSGHVKPLSKADAKFLDDAIALAESMAKQSLQEVERSSRGSGSDCSDDGGVGSSGGGSGGKDQSPKTKKR